MEDLRCESSQYTSHSASDVRQPSVLFSSGRLSRQSRESHTHGESVDKGPLDFLTMRDFVSIQARTATIFVLVASAIFYAAGISYFHFQMGLSVIDAAFFSVSTITTVGYGEAQDELTDSDKLFIIFFTLFGVNICWIIVGNLILYVVNVFTSNMKYTRKKFAERVDILAERENSAYASNKHSTNLETKPSLLQRMLTGVSVDFNQEEEISMEEYIELSRFQNKRTQNKLFRGFLRNIFIIFVLLFFGTVIYACIESESIVNSLFWAIDTLCSVNVVI